MFPIQLATSPTGLYLINLIDICPGEETAFFQSQVPKTSDEVKGISSNGDMLELNINKNSISHGDRIDGDNQCRSAAKAETQRVQRSRSFRSKNPPLSQTADLCSTITMPPMVSMLKSIAEAIINLLTLLLQILVHQLEKQEVIVESEAQNDQELHASLHEMMNQINVQRASLEALKGEIVAKKTSPKRGIPTASMSAGSSPPIEDSVAMVPTQTKNVVQRRSKAPSMTSQAPS